MEIINAALKLDHIVRLNKQSDKVELNLFC